MAQSSRTPPSIETKKFEGKVTDLPNRQAVDFVSLYSNHVEIRVSPGEVRLMFCEIVDAEADDSLINERKAAIVMSPQNAMAFTGLLVQSMTDLKEQLSEALTPSSAPPPVDPNK